MRTTLLLIVFSVLTINFFAQAKSNVKPYKNKSGKWGFIDKKSEKEVIPCIYDSIYYSSCGISYIKKSNCWGIAGHDGKELAPCIYDKVYVRSCEDHAIVTKKGKTGVVDFKGHVIVPLKFDKVSGFNSPGLTHFIVTKNNKEGIYNKEGQQKLPAIYDKIDIFYEDGKDSSAYMELYKDGKTGLADTHGNLVIEPELNKLLCYRQGYNVAKKDKWGVLSSDGHCIIPYQYDTIEIPHFSGNKITYESGLIYLFTGKIRKKEKREKQYEGKFSVANMKGEILADHKYDYIYNRTEIPPTQVSCNGKIGMIGKHGEEIVPCKYDWVEPVELDIYKIEGLYKYLIGTKTYNWDKFTYEFEGKFGLITAGGEEVTKADFSEIKLTNGKYAYVRNFENKCGIFDESGKIIIPCKFDQVRSYYNYSYSYYDHLEDKKDYWEVFIGSVDKNNNKHGKFGLFHDSGEAFTKVEYDEIIPLKDGGCKVKNNGKWAVLSEKGELLTEYKYDKILGDYNDERLRVFIGKKTEILEDDDDEGNEYKGLFGFIDKSGKEVIPLKYTEVYPFNKGKADVFINEKDFIIDLNGSAIEAE